MAKQNISKQENTQQETTNNQVVMITVGAGTEPITIAWSEGMTVTAALQTAKVELGEGETPVIGETLIENPDETVVEAGQMIVVADMPANG